MKSMYLLEKGDFIESLFYAHSVRINKAKKLSILEDITENLLSEDGYAKLEGGAYEILHSQDVVINDITGLKVSFDPARLENLILKTYKVPGILFREISNFYNLGFVLMSYGKGKKMNILINNPLDGKACILVLMHGTEKVNVFSTGKNHIFKQSELNKLLDKLESETVMLE